MTDVKPAAAVTILPALRGVMGSWVYYSCLMTLRDLSALVSFAEDVHEYTGLSQMIQRDLSKERTQTIADYIKRENQRFFNSLVVAVYGGEPDWHALTNVRKKSIDDLLENLQAATIESVGFLTLRGDEHLFALDGQHRLAGMKAIVDEQYESALDDEVSVIFVGHERTDAGLERTRRLFTTLNKTARPVSKRDIIALDEDDVMAICVRRLIEQTDLFPGNGILRVESNNIPPQNFECLTTIGNLYDILTILFTKAKFALRKRKANLQSFRPPDATLDRYFEYSKEFFVQLRSHFPEFDEFFSACRTSEVVRRYRGREEGNALYRPVGLDIFTEIITRVTQAKALDDAIATVAKLPRALNNPPYSRVIWDPDTGTMITGAARKVTAREILAYMIGRNRSAYTEEKLLERYRRDTGDAEVELPTRLD